MSCNNDFTGIKQDYNFNFAPKTRLYFYTVYVQDAVNCTNNWQAKQKNEEMNERANDQMSEWMRFRSSVSICHVHNIISIIIVNDAMGKLTITRQAYFIFYHMLPLVRVSNVTLLNLISSSTGTSAFICEADDNRRCVVTVIQNKSPPAAYFCCRSSTI